MEESKSELWEAIDSTTKRMSIPSGWLVKTSAIFKEAPQMPASISCSMCYVLDHDHRWVLNKKEEDK